MKSHAMLAAAALLLSACTAKDEGETPAPDDTPPPAAGQAAPPAAQPEDSADPALPTRPETRADTLMLEGMPEIERATLVRSPPDFALPFSTYVSSGMRTEFRTGDGGSAVRFSAAFGGVENRNAYLQVYVYDAGVERPTVNDVITGFVRSRAPGIDEAASIETPPWALEAMRFAYIGTGGVRMVGRTLTGEHNGRYFHVIAHYPQEYAEGMGPRIDRILRQWRWEDTGALLVR